MSTVLPIDSIESTFIAKLKDTHLVVAAATGSGKSTRLPIWAAGQGRVLVIEPRRVACTALAGFVAEQTETRLGEDVGYAIRFDNRYQSTTRIIFVTPGVALRWFAEDRLSGFDTVILDEFHERRWDTDLLLAQLKQQVQHRLVLTSATLNAQRLADYLTADVLQADGRNFDVELFHRAKDPRQMPDARELEQQIRAAVSDYFDRHRGDTLVFLPGRKEIQQTMAALKVIDADVIPLHASVSAEDQKRALSVGSRRRVILATNVAETSLTIPGVTLVVDSGLERRTHQRNGRTVLGLHTISKASAEQRKGRAGRVEAGLCVRLWGEHAPLELVTPPEVQREELADMMLAAACSGYSLDALSFADTLPEKSLRLARDKLLEMRAIDEAGQVTELGIKLFPLPLDTQFAHLITAMPNPSLQGAMVDLAASLSAGGRWLKLPKSEQGLQAVQAWLSVPCDALTLIAALRGQAKESVPEEIGIDRAGWKEARRLATQIRSALGLGEIPAGIDFDRDQWLLAVMQAQPATVYIRRAKRRGAMGNGYAEIMVGEQCRMSEEFEAAVLLDDYSMPGRGTRQTLTIGTCLAPVKLGLLVQAGLGELKQGRVIWESGQLSVEQQRTYVERVIHSETVIPEGEVARRAIAELILRGSLMPGVADQLRRDLDAWSLFVALGEAEGDVPEAETWLRNQLELLGVEQADDMALIDATDLQFEGIPDWQRNAFDEKYPMLLSLGDLRLKVHYDVKKKQVVIERLAGTRKDDPKRWELPVWKGWKIRYKKASRVVDIR
ncbi:helicase-related protein [Pontibacterium granulatum]|uniref:helicase-related protein n=1 Tax=Pontibacterium granulatum TaxID=2036029 RepID=UPI00249ABC7F|nr:helicase-related protein [Pontibacterium granulatum]MDI3326109.1 helicase-related protein [Pontibacterium granulatum]